jgi:hypothetical protein
MDWPTLIPAVFSLVGVAIGAMGSIAVGYFARRTSLDQTRVQQTAALRAERKEIILDYMRHMQAFHDFTASIWQGERFPADTEAGNEIRGEASKLGSEMWFQQKKLLIVASHPLREASLALTTALNDALYKNRPAETDFFDFIDPFQDRFFEAARKDLGIAVDRIAVRGNLPR